MGRVIGTGKIEFASPDNNNGPATLEQLAAVEQNILDALDELAEKLLGTQAEDDKKS